MLGFHCAHERPREGFCHLKPGEESRLMIDQIGPGRSFDAGHLPMGHPFGMGLNGQIRVPTVAPLVEALALIGGPRVLPPEDKWYRVGPRQVGNRHFDAADPDGDLLRFLQDLGARPWGAPLCTRGVRRSSAACHPWSRNSKKPR